MDKLPPENKREKNMKKNKSKVPVAKIGKPVSKMVTEGITDSMADSMLKEFNKMTPEEQARFKQQTLDGLRKSISNMVERAGGSKEKRIVPKSNLDDPYAVNAVNPHSRGTVPDNDISDLIKQKPLNEQETELLRCRISEYLKSFAIFGYDISGNRVLITSCKTTQERDSILQMSQHMPPVLFQMFNGRDPSIEDIF
jgi:hypothetical protein